MNVLRRNADLGSQLQALRIEQALVSGLVSIGTVVDSFERMNLCYEATVSSKFEINKGGKADNDDEVKLLRDG